MIKELKKMVCNILFGLQFVGGVMVLAVPVWAYQDNLAKGMGSDAAMREIPHTIVANFRNAISR